MDRNYVDDTVPIKMKWCVSGNNNSCNHDNLDPYIEHIQGVFGNSVIVSLPSYDQIYKAAGYKETALPLWLYDNLYSDTNSSLPYGYWTSTSYSIISTFAWYVIFDGYLASNIVYSDYGLRPVITISKSSMD